MSINSEYFQLNEHLDGFDITTVSKIPDYKNENNTFVEEKHAYFDMNRSHCHRPENWKKQQNDLIFNMKHHHEEHSGTKNPRF